MQIDVKGLCVCGLNFTPTTTTFKAKKIKEILKLDFN